MTSNIILWVYIILLLVGGLIGFLRAGSKISLITSIIFAIGLALCAVGTFSLNHAMVIVGLLALFFAVRFASGKKQPGHCGWAFLALRKPDHASGASAAHSRLSSRNREILIFER